MRVILALSLPLVALAGCLADAPDEQNPQETGEPRSAGRVIAGPSSRQEPAPENLTRHSLDESFALVSSGSEVAGFAGVNLNGPTCVVVDGPSGIWKPIHLEATATWSAATPAAAEMELRVYRGGSQVDSVTGTSPLTLQTDGFEAASDQLLVRVDEAVNGATVEQEIQLEIRLAYDATEAARAGTAC